MDVCGCRNGCDDEYPKAINQSISFVGKFEIRSLLRRVDYEWFLMWWSCFVCCVCGDEDCSLWWMRDVMQSSTSSCTYSNWTTSTRLSVCVFDVSVTYKSLSAFVFAYSTSIFIWLMASCGRRAQTPITNEAKIRVVIKRAWITVHEYF
jgi:hypothetical protein